MLIQPRLHSGESASGDFFTNHRLERLTLAVDITDAVVLESSSELNRHYSEINE